MDREEVLDLDVFLKEVYGDIVSMAKDDGVSGVQASMIPVMVAISMGKASVSSIRDEVRLTQQGVGKTLKVMESAGLVIRRRSEKDQRTMDLQVTDKGVLLLGIIDTVANNWGY